MVKSVNNPPRARPRASRADWINVHSDLKSQSYQQSGVWSTSDHLEIVEAGDKFKELLAMEKY